MVYVKAGNGVVTDAANDETADVSAGSMVMISDGDVQWSSISEDGLTLLSMVTPLDEVTPAKEDNFKLQRVPTAEGADKAEDDDLSIGELAGLLVGGVLSGLALQLGVQLLQTPDVVPPA